MKNSRYKMLYYLFMFNELFVAKFLLELYY